MPAAAAVQHNAHGLFASSSGDVLFEIWGTHTSFAHGPLRYPFEGHAVAPLSLVASRARRLHSLQGHDLADPCRCCKPAMPASPVVGIAANAQLFATKSLGGSPTRCSSASDGASAPSRRSDASSLHLQPKAHPEPRTPNPSSGFCPGQHGRRPGLHEPSHQRAPPVCAGGWRQVGC